MTRKYFIFVATAMLVACTASAAQFTCTAAIANEKVDVPYKPGVEIPGVETFNGTYYVLNTERGYEIVPITDAGYNYLHAVGVNADVIDEATITVQADVLADRGHERSQISLRVGNVQHDLYRDPIYYNDPKSFFAASIQVDPKAPTTVTVPVIEQTRKIGSASMNIRCITASAGTR